MAIGKFLSLFVPQNKGFFTLFTQSSENLVQIAQAFNELLHVDVANRNELYRKIENLEHRGDEITHKIFTELSVNFLTPFDREDISYLAASLDDIADFIHGSAKKLEIYRITDISVSMKKLGELIEFSAKEIHTAISHLKEAGQSVRVREALIRINSLENHADDIYDNTIAELFEREKDAVKLIKLKEILSNMETATDKCEDVANVIETIIVKNS